MKKLMKFYILAFVLFSDFAMFSQPGEGAEGGGSPLEESDPQPAPINSKLMVLAILGIAFVIYTYRKNKKIV
jgi:hypothetical protein